MHFDLILRGGTLVSSNGRWQADIGVTGAKIAAIGDLSLASAEHVEDVAGLHILPGLIDTQVHFREPGMEHKEDIESGTRAALAGGVTTVFEMPNTNPSTTTAEALQDKLTRSQGRSWSNIAFFVGAAIDNIEELSELEMLPGTPGVKLFMGSSTGTLLVPDDEHVRRVMQNGKRPMPVHSEDTYRLNERFSMVAEGANVAMHPEWRDAETARLCTERLLSLTAETGRATHVLHISTADELPLLANAKAKGLPVTCEITPQHLWFCAPDAYDQLGTFAQMNPPIRTCEHREALRQAVKSGLFDVIGSDHAPHTREEKSSPYPKSPSGMPGVQTLLSATLTMNEELGLMSLERFVEMACEKPALLYGIANKGFLQEGYDADITLVDLDKTYVFEEAMVQSKCGWSPYTGAKFKGEVAMTIVQGTISYRDRTVIGAPSGATPQFTWKPN